MPKHLPLDGNEPISDGLQKHDSFSQTETLRLLHRKQVTLRRVVAFYCQPRRAGHVPKFATRHRWWAELHVL